MSSLLVYVLIGYMTLVDFQSLLDASPDSSNLTEKTDYKYTPGIGAYKIHTNPVTWNEARRACKREGAYLAIMNSVDEVEVVCKFLDDAGLWQAHVGFHDMFSEDEWVTIHNEPLEKTGFTKWVIGEPSSGNGNIEENCGALRASKELNDVSCLYRQAFVCELFIV